MVVTFSIVNLVLPFFPANRPIALAKWSPFKGLTVELKIKHFKFKQTCNYTWIIKNVSMLRIRKFIYISLLNLYLSGYIPNGILAHWLPRADAVGSEIVTTATKNTRYSNGYCTVNTKQNGMKNNFEHEMKNNNSSFVLSV